MKILLIHPRETKFYKDRVLGGLETVFVNQMKLLSEDNDVSIFISKESDDYDGVNCIHHDLFCMLEDETPSRKYNKEYSSALAATILNGEYDVIINHANMANCVIDVLIGTSIPSITFIHNCTAVAGGIAMFPFMERLSKYSSSGGVVVNVSESSMNDWGDKFTKKYPLDKNIFNRFFYTPVAFSEPVVSESEGYGLMVSRISEDKRIASVIKTHEKINKKFVLCHVPPMRESEHEYMKEVISSCGENTKLMCGLPREDILSVISKAEYVVVSGPESFGLVAYEANLHGVPVILNTSSTNHPVMEIGRFTDVIGAVSQAPKAKNSDFFLSYSSLKYTERLELSKKIYGMFNKETSINKLNNLIQDSIEEKRNHVGNNYTDPWSL